MSTEKSISTLLLDGGTLCLNFTNTIANRSVPEPFDYLGNYLDILRWYRRTEVLKPSVIKTLERLAKAYPPKAAAVFEKAIALRELLYAMFAGQAEGLSPKEQLVAEFNQYLAAAFSQLNLDHYNRKEPATLSFTMPELDLVWWEIVKSAVEVFTSRQLQLVRRCPACNWLFVDKSKNHSRKWCNMATCGDVHKVKQFYERKKKSDR
ncbi:CGNR zinc finger domain-containing protein [uncultured Chitinophaga sp.]|uniref:CGNR zinc finger domain-containing protein n=1 Tax=uncultured Chitinophaga sp. TaxID=339340 RepID=UPI0025EF7085|nr:CGNR zinc finger domain-containing protein [uncultured Chitinophaga sp.]